MDILCSYSSKLTISCYFLKFQVRVMAYNSAGPGPESERFLERTFKLRPQKPPTAVQVNISDVTFNVSLLMKLVWFYASQYCS